MMQLSYKNQAFFLSFNISVLKIFRYRYLISYLNHFSPLPMLNDLLLFPLYSSHLPERMLQQCFSWLPSLCITNTYEAKYSLRHPPPKKGCTMNIVREIIFFVMISSLRCNYNIKRSLFWFNTYPPQNTFSKTPSSRH